MAGPLLAPQGFSLGDIVFDLLQFEVPADLEIGRRTLGGVTEIPQSDGQPAVRVSQTLGVVVDTIKFEAAFIGTAANGATALDRARGLEYLQQQQKVVPFRFASLSFDVTIFSVVEKYRSINEIVYAVELEPLRESSSPSASPSAASALSQGLDAIAVFPPLTVQDVDLQAAISAIDAAQAAALAAAASNSLPSLLLLLATFRAAIDALSVLMGAKAASTATNDVSIFLYAASLRGMLASASATIGTMTGTNAQTSVNPSGMNAYQLAVRYTGDIANTDAIMQANNLTDPFNLGTAPLVIPTALSMT